MAEITLYTNPMSRGQIAHWMLEELGEPYETEWIAYGPEGIKSARFLAINPMGKLPTVVHAGKTITEAGAICLYLADAFADKGLGPQPDERADYYRWTIFAIGPVEHAVTSQAMGWTVPEEKERMVGFGSYEATLAALEQHLKGRAFVCGDRFTAADVYVGSAVAWGVSFGTIPKRPAFAAYAERVTARDAHKRCTAINDERRASAT